MTTSRSSALWAPERRAVTTAILLLITLAAFEALAVSTALPTLVADLRGESLYSWPFTSYLAASVVATVLSGRACDRWGPAPALLAAPLVFLVGLVVAGVAVNMPMLLVGRVLQGFGGGVEIVAVYVLIAAVYPEEDRAAAFGAMSAAWVVPSLVGPTVAGLVTEHLTWRLIFLGLVPLTLVAWLLLLSVLRRMLRESVASSDTQEDPVPRPRLPLAALAAAIGLTAVTWAAQHPSGRSLLLGVVGLVVLLPALRHLLPAGTLTARPGLPTFILSRGLLAGAFFSVEAYLPLTLTAVHDYSPAEAGLPLTVGAIGWSLGSAWQSRRSTVPRETFLRIGFGMLAVALAAIALVAPEWGPAWLAAPIWAVSGAAMGLAMPCIGVKVLELSEPKERGFNSSALQVCDMLTSALLTGLGGVALNTLASAAEPTAAVVPLDLAMALVAATGVLLVRPRRTRNVSGAAVRHG